MPIQNSPPKSYKLVKHFVKHNIQDHANAIAMENEINGFLSTLQYGISARLTTNTVVIKGNPANTDDVLHVVFVEYDVVTL